MKLPAGGGLEPGRGRATLVAHMKVIKGAASVLLLFPLMPACGPSVAESARPKPMTASRALGDKSASETGVCRDVAEGGRPLVVDWRPEQRGDLEVAMKQGI